MTDQINHQRQNLLEEENQRLRLAVEELSVLNDIATAITSTQSLQQIVDLIIQKCVKHLKVEQGAVMLLDEKDQANPFHTIVRKQDTIRDVLPFRLDTQLTGWMIKNKAPLLINDFRTDSRFSWLTDQELPVHSLLSVPMMLKGRMIGVVTVFNKRLEMGFTDDDQRLLAIIAAQSSHVVEYARLYQKEQSLLRLQEEMRLATEIQVNLLPTHVPNIPGYDIAGKSIPAKEVGGDYFDYIPLNESSMAFCLGDVSGKGIPAALLMANLQATLRGQSGPDISPSLCVQRSNRLIFQSTDSQKFATLFYGILNSEEHKISYCNAGHDNPIRLKKGEDIDRLKAGGIVLGFVPEFSFAEEKISMDSGDVLVLYSDGITEAMNSKEEEFGENRLMQTVTKNRDKPSREIIENIINTVRQHIGTVPQMDDMTLLVVKRL